MKKFLIILLFFGIGISCGGGHTLRYPPTPWVNDLDKKPIVKPAPRYAYKISDIGDKQVYYQLERLGDLSLRGEMLGSYFGMKTMQEALNINNFDEVADSTWFHNRIGRKSMTVQQIVRAANKGTGPSSGTWEILAAKTEGLSPGLIIKDKKGDKYLLKFDPSGHWALASGAEIISTKFLYAAGYHVPENFIVRFNPKNLYLPSTATTQSRYGKTIKFTQQALKSLFDRIDKNHKGQFRALASKFLPGEPVGPFRLLGTRVRDTNDKIMHQHRRELRGYRVFSAFLNNSDAREANTLDMFIRYPGRDTGYLKHHMIDFGGTLGSGGVRPKDKNHMYDYRFNYAKTGASLLTGGAPQYYWNKAKNPENAAVGMFEAELFKPQSWRSTYPNPPMQNATHRDSFWATKILMKFSDKDIRAIVKEAQYGDAWVNDYITKILIERRNKIGKYWFTKLNPLDEFTIASKNDENFVQFDDLAIDAGLSQKINTKYRYRWEDIKGMKKWAVVRDKEIPLSNAALNQMKPGKHYKLQIQTKRTSQKKWSPSVDLIIQQAGDPQIMGLRRHY